MSIRTRLALSGDRGSISSTVVLVVFATLLTAAIATSVVSHVTASARMSESTDMNSSSSIFSNSYLSQIASGQSPSSELCVDGSCTKVLSTTTDAGVRTLEVEATARSGRSQGRSLNYREITGTAIAGFDAAGNPVWQAAEDLTPHKFTQVVAYAGHACGIDPDKAAWCWGDNTDGQLGDGTNTSSAEPVKVSGSHLFASLAAGDGASTCGIDADGKAWCWGANTNGELGVGDTTPSNTPVQPTGGHTFTGLTMGANTVCGIDTTDGSWCWGTNPGGASQAATTEPVAVAGGRDYTGFVLAPAATCALDSTGKAWCWSSGDGADGLVTACTTDCTATEHLPAAVEDDKVFTALTITQSGTPTVCGLDPAEAAWCWGDGSSGKRGIGSTTSSPTPAVLTGRTFQTIAASAGTFCGLDTGRAWCWGANTAGETGTGTTDAATSPATAGSSTYTKLAAGTQGTFCGLTSDAVECWGANSAGQANPGTGSNTLAPSPVEGLVRPTKLVMGPDSVCSVNFRSEGHCWGDTARGNNITKTMPYEIGRLNATVASFTGYIRGGH